DVLRGFALLGIIFNNMLYFSGYAYMPFDDLRQIIDLKLHEDLYYFLDIVITAKFYTLFSLLFAVGFYIQLSKHTEDATGFLKTYRRRLFILLAIGLIHSLIWSGDILLTYSIMGFIIILFRNVRPRNLIRWALLFMLLPFIIDLALLPFFTATDAITAENAAPIAHVSFPDMAPEAVINTFQNGTIPEIFALNIHNLVWRYASFIPSGMYFTIFGIFLLGYYLASIGFFTRKSTSTLFSITSLIIGLVATVSANILGGNPYQFPPTLTNILFKFLESTGQIFMCFFYVASIFKIVQTPIGRRLFKQLIPVGRMALSNYLFQTIGMIIIFYNFGFDLFGRTGLIQTTGIAILLLVLQIIISNIWLQHFRFGPFEWFWRSLTYKMRIGIRYDKRPAVYS
ncbi:MAG: DUF418 domain-containing protein, partial [Chitinivibrionia bacterium]|nr:DUF418 domain-containing protein [Chitinivibrionia bacterium]